jgi:hypothetical protein
MIIDNKNRLLSVVEFKHLIKIRHYDMFTLFDQASMDESEKTNRSTFRYLIRGKVSEIIPIHSPLQKQNRS